MFRLYYLIPLLIPLALARRDFSLGVFHRLERWGARMAAVPWRAVSLAGLFSLALSMGLSLGNRLPAPQVHDEFGYLLLGDTFAHGRVTNPQPPLWQHFETIHEIMHPTYTAKYPPGQGVALAIGEALGKPIFGVWLTTALACAAMCWMFMGWMPKRWALAGGLMVALHPQVLEWSQNYWGGAVAMTGGALVLGGFRRIVREPRAGDAAWMGIGLVVLANSRPFEGFVLATLICGTLLAWAIREGRTRLGLIFRRVFVPLAAIIVLLGLQVGYYNWRVTGSPLVMPYAEYQKQYAMAPQILFEKPHPDIQYTHPEIHALHAQYLAYFMMQHRSFADFLGATMIKIMTLAEAYSWSWLMAIPLVAFPWAARRDCWLRFAPVMAVGYLVITLIGTWMFPHFAAPAAPLFFVLVLGSMRALNAWHAGRWRVGRNLVRGMILLFVISFVQIRIELSHRERASLWYYRREALLDQLRLEPGKSLLIVKYEPGHNPNREWVYNDADMADAKVILARDMGAQNRELTDFYRDRKALIIDADAANPEIEPYPGS